MGLQNGHAREQLIHGVVASAEREADTVVGLDFAFSFPRWWCLERGWNDVREVWETMEARARMARERPSLYSKSAAPGAVGTGSIRGMPHLLTLARHGLAIWPFHETRWPFVIEIYPRALTRPVNKSRWTDRHEYLSKHFPEQAAPMLERAAGSEDSFDAAVSALVMAAQQGQLAALKQLADPYYAIEGKIWRPV